MFVSSLLASCLAALGAARLVPSVKVMGELGAGGFLENIAVRPNGDILATTLFPNASVYSLSKPTSKHQSLDLLASVPSIESLLGIAELNADGEEVFVVVGGNVSSFDGSTPPIFQNGSFSAWTITFGDQEPRVAKVSDLSSTSQFLNGVAAVPWLRHTAFVADSRLGIVGRLDTSTGVYEPHAFSFPEMAPPPGSAFGVNGLKVSGSYLYWTNSGLRSIFRVSITPDGYSVGEALPELVAGNLSKNNVDDFAIAGGNGIFAATNLDNSVVYIDPSSGKSKTILEGSIIQQLMVRRLWPLVEG